VTRSTVLLLQPTQCPHDHRHSGFARRHHYDRRPLHPAAAARHLALGKVDQSIYLNALQDRPHLYRTPLTAPGCGHATSIQGPRNGTV